MWINLPTPLWKYVVSWGGWKFSSVAFFSVFFGITGATVTCFGKENSSLKLCNITVWVKVKPYYPLILQPTYSYIFHNQITSSFYSLTSLLHHILQNTHSNQSRTTIPTVLFLSTWKICMGLHLLYYIISHKMIWTALSKTSFLIYSIHNIFWVASIPHSFSILLQILPELLTILSFIIHQINHVKMNPLCTIPL